MSNVAFRRDLSDPKTIQNFVDLVQSPERLRMLLCLTVADIRAVGPNVWNNWKADLLRQLYREAETVMSGGFREYGLDGRIKTVQKQLADSLADWPEVERQAHLDSCGVSYLLSWPVEMLVHQANFMRQAERDERHTALDLVDEPDRAVTRLTVYTENRPALFATLAGALALSGVSIVDAKIYSFTNSRVLDSFWLHGVGGGVLEGREQDKVRETVRKALFGAMSLRDMLEGRDHGHLRSHPGLFSVSPQVVVDNDVSTRHTVVEVTGRDRLGLLFYLTSALAEQGVHIARARIATYGERAVDVFYVDDGKGGKIVDEKKLKRLQGALMRALEES